MPNALLQHISTTHNIPLPDVEHAWEKSKGIVHHTYVGIDDDSDRYYKLVVKIMKNILKIKKVIRYKKEKH